MNIDDMILNIRRMPQLYFKLNAKPFESLVNFLSGYEFCYRNVNNYYLVCDKRGEILPDFNEFVREYYKSDKLKWYQNILAFENSEKVAYEKFFQLYALYKNIPELYLSDLYIFVTETRKNIPKCHYSQIFDHIKECYPWFFDSGSDIYRVSPFRNFEYFIKYKLSYKGHDSWLNILYCNHSDDNDFITFFFKFFDEYCSMMLQLSDEC